MRFLLALAFAATVYGAALLPCTRTGFPSAARPYGTGFPWPEENATKHYPRPDLCLTWENPYCIKSNEHAQTYNDQDAATWEYGCAQCRDSCDCPIGEYCQIAYSEQADFGTCLSYKALLGEPCSPIIASQVDAYYGKPMVCGVGIEYRDYQENMTQFDGLWAGACIHGRCRECNSYVIPKPGHYVNNGIWYSGSAQNENAARTLQCLWAGAPGGMTSHAPYKYHPRICRSHSWKYEDGVSSLAPLAVLLLALLLL